MKYRSSPPVNLFMPATAYCAEMVGRVPVQVLGCGYRSGYEVMHERAAIAERFERMAGKQDIVVYHRRPVADFDQYVLAVVAEHDVAADARVPCACQSSQTP